ncbi:MAG: hypothetical protein NC181_05470 [Clostridium sp.]|nr:hypothetical protein [Clostridium sp.]MCM1444686.1 hypothetical protein [Candidatus Amulumruptor caecigallinarius]
MFEVGNKTSRFIFYRNNFFKKNKKIFLEKNEKVYNKVIFLKTPKRKSKISNFFAVLVGFIFGFFDNIPRSMKFKSNVKQNNKIKNDNIIDNKTKENAVLYKENEIILLKQISKVDEKSINEIVNTENKKNNIIPNEINEKIKYLNVKNKVNKNDKKVIFPIEVITAYEGIKKVIHNSNKDKKSYINQNKNSHNGANKKINFNLEQVMTESSNIYFKQQELKQKNNIDNKEQEKSVDEKVNIDSYEIDKGIGLISKELEKQGKYLKKVDEILRKYNDKIKYKLKMNYFSNFFTNVLKVVGSLLPLRFFRNKLFGCLVSSILLNNSIQTFRNNMTLKNNATLIVPQYLKQMKTETDIITSLKLVCENSLKHFYLLREEFFLYNNKYIKTDEFKNFLKKLDIIEKHLVKDLEYSKRLLLERENIEKHTKQKVYKIIRK